MSDRIGSYFIGGMVTIVMTISGLILLNDYARAEDFFIYRLAFNLAEGNGLVYNTTEKALPTISPLFAVILGCLTQLAGEFANFTPNLLDVLATVIVALLYGITASLIHQIACRSGMSKTEALWIVVAWLLTWPVWAGFRSAAPMTLLFILMALSRGERDYWRQAGFIAGLATLAQPTGLLGGLALGVYALGKDKRGHYWQTVWLPLTVWMVFAAWFYTDGYWKGLSANLGTPEIRTMPSLLWVGLLVAAVRILYFAKIKNWLWVLVLWATLEIAAPMLVYGELVQVESLALGLSIASSIVIGARFLPRPRLIIGASCVALLTILLLTPPQTDKRLRQDIALGESLLLPANSDLLTDRSEALIDKMPNFDGNIYRLDGKHSLYTDDFIQRDDIPSLIIAIAPRYIYLNQDIDLQNPVFEALDYRQEIDVELDPGQREGDVLWIRQSEISEFGKTQTVDMEFSEDIWLKSYATDRTRFQPNQPVRIRLDWELTRPPTDTITIQLNLLDTFGAPLVSLFPAFPAENWETLAMSTYHVLSVPEDTLAGLVQIQVSLDYKAAILGRARFGSLVVALPQQDEMPTELIGQIADAVLYSADVAVIDGRIQVELKWGVNAVLSRDYQVLVHLVPFDNPSPVAFGDGPPLEGRYPTSLWLPNELIPDRHLVQGLENAPPGRYRIMVGFYILETFERLRDDQKDSLAIAEVTITENREIRVRLLHERQNVWG